MRLCHGLVALGVLFAAGGARPAHAQGQLATHGGGTVLEASYHVDIAVRGLFATVETRQRLLAGGGGAPTEAVYTFELPGDAAVTGFSLATGDGAAEAAVITTEAGAVGDASSTLGDDRGELRLMAAGRGAGPGDPGTPATYRYTAYPVGSGGVTATVRWIMPIRLEQGRLVIALPARRGLDLAAPTGTITFAPVAGLTAPRGVRVGGTVVAAAPGAKRVSWTAAAEAPIVVEADVTTTGAAPVFLADTIALGKGQGAIAAAVIAPAAGKRGAGAGGKAAKVDRLVVIVDASRSMRRIDRAAVVAAAAAVTAAAPASAQLLGLAFDRAPRRLVPAWAANDAAGRAAIGAAIEQLGDANGTDLRAALADAAAAIEAGHRGRIVVITDAGFDPALDADALVRALGDRAGDVEVSALIAVPADRLAPDHGVAVLSEVARRVGGRVRIGRADELADRARRLSSELGDAAAWSQPEVAGTTLAFPAVLGPGDGAAAIGWYTGAGKPQLVIERGDKVTKVAAKPLAKSAGALAAPLGLRAPGALVEGAAWATAVRAHPVVAAASALLVVDASTKLGRDRRTLIARGAPFVRLPPRPERDAEIGAPDPDALVPRPAGATDPLAGGVLDPDSVKNILTIELLGRLRACYQRALTTTPDLRGRVAFEILIGDAEVIAAGVSGADEASFERCLVVAAHGIQIPPVADPSLIRVRYPVDFTVTGSKPFVVLGDADSAEPLDPSLLPTPIDTSGADDPLDGLHK